MIEDVVITAEDGRKVYVDKLDDNIWLAIHTMGGSAYCQITPPEAQRMIAALQELLNEEAIV